MKKTFNIILAGIIILSFLYVFYPLDPCSASGSTLNVPGDFSTIQAAIDAASSGDTVLVSSGTYNENIIIEKSLSLTGEDKGSTVIMGVSENDITLTIKGNFLEYVSNVLLSGFQILQNPTAISNEYACLYVEYAQGCTITDCIIKDSYNGIRMKQTDESTISENTIENNDGDGILLFIYSDKNEIKNNLIKSNNRGIYLQDFCTENTIASNDIFGNSNHGIQIIGNSNNNIIYHNDFENSNNANDESTNTWYYSSEGNYWNDYTGSDSNGDGKGDTPYNIPGGSNQDLYPLGDFSGPNQQPVATIQSISPNPAIEGQTISFNGYGTDPDGSIVAWEWKIDGVTVSGNEDYSSSSYTLGTYSVTYRVKDDGGSWSSFKSDTFTVASEENNAPIAYFLSPEDSKTVIYGESVRFYGTGQDPDDGDSISYSWSSDKDGTLSSESEFYKSDLSINTHTITFRVTDNHDAYSEETRALNVIKDPNVENNPPVADTGGPYTGVINNTVSFNGSNSYDPDEGDSITDYSWDFGDETKGSGVAVEHIYSTSGEYTVQLTVTDSHGEQHTSETTVNIASESNGQGGSGNDKWIIPGFEIIIVTIAIAFIVLWKKQRKK